MIAKSQKNSNQQPLDWKLWKSLFRFVKPYRREVGLLGAAAIVTAAVETAFPLLTKQVIDAISEDGHRVDLMPYVLAYVALLFMIGVSIWSFIRLAGKLRTYISHDIRQAGFENLQHLSFSFYDKHETGWLISRMTSDCARLSNIMAWGILDIVWGLTFMMGIMIAMLCLHFYLGLLVLSVLPVLAWVSVIFSRRLLKSSRAVRKANSQLTSDFNESLMGVSTTKVFTREDENLEEFQTDSLDMYQKSMKNALLSALYLPVVMILGSVSTALILGVGGLQVSKETLSLGTLIAFMAYARQFFNPVQELARIFAELQMAQASAERIMGLVNAEAEIKDSAELVTVIEENKSKAEALKLEDKAVDGYSRTIDQVKFENVSFAYKDDKMVLKDFDLTVQKGESIAFVGSTGSGKSTLISLLCRFYEPTNGRILINSVDYKKRGLNWFQSNLGIVLQTPHLFRGTIADNIRYGKLIATEDEIIAAAKLVGAHDFIEALPEGYDSEVGEGGNRLSTGEKQLLSFARAILGDPQILIMDEATSSIDTETERKIQDGTDVLMNGRMSFIIAHRLSTIRNVDRILVIDQGFVKEQGSHEELMALGGHYHELYTRQSLERSSLVQHSWA
ncbi:MAG: ABC transporter ATP-binding protein [Planctomycetota bacterium]|nr:ABC transporter ATP-binding protein [Planctomycetota bacterium]